jgi:hypothetical protein
LCGGLSGSGGEETGGEERRGEMGREYNNTWNIVWRQVFPFIHLFILFVLFLGLCCAENFPNDVEVLSDRTVTHHQFR